MGSMRLILVAALCSIAAAGTLAQDAGNAGAQNPAPINTFELEAAYRHDFGPGAKDERH